MISGTVTLKDGTKIELNDNNIVSGSVKYSMNTSSGGKFDIGTFNAARLRIGIFDEQSAGREFDTAEIKLFEGENEEKLKATGVYYVDGTQTDRRGKIIKLTAYDGAVKFDVEKLKGVSGDAATVIGRICEHIGIELVPFENDDFVNTEISTDDSDEYPDITTCRDQIMWICKWICANAVMNRVGQLEIRKAKYTADGEEIAITHTFTADDREDIQFSDTRTYIKYLTAYIDGKPQPFESTYTSSDVQARAAAFNLPENAFYLDAQKYSNSGENNIKAWLKYIDGFKQREIKATVFNGEKVSLGDTCRFKGGKIDIGRNIVGVVTDIERTYNGKTVIICHAPSAVETEVTNELETEEPDGQED